MKLTFKEVTDWETDYPILSRWWVGHGRDVVPLQLLQAGTCYMTLGDEKPMTFSCLYFGDKGYMCWMAWLLTNPSLPAFTSMKIIRQTLSWLELEAVANGMSIIFTAVNIPSLGRLYESDGFLNVEKDVKTYVKPLKREEASGN